MKARTFLKTTGYAGTSLVLSCPTDLFNRNLQQCNTDKTTKGSDLTGMKAGRPSGQEPCPAEALAEVREDGADTVRMQLYYPQPHVQLQDGACSEDFTLLAHFKALS